MAAPGDLPRVMVDEKRLAQVFHNLLSNALRHTPGGGEIEVGSCGGNCRVQFWVKNSGSGIDPAHLPHIFERFYRADESRSRHTGGTGLGLAIARQFVRLHGGEIRAVNEGDGARFEFWIPTNSEEKNSGTESSSAH
jgi:signal transduction histidine kinase